MTHEEFINVIAPAAQEEYQRNGILPSVTIAQAIVESGWGESGLTQVANNLFGIKGEYNGNGVNYPTKEWNGKEYVSIVARFRQYPDWASSIADHGKLLDLPRYAPVRAATSAQGQCDELQACGYATSPTYAAALMEIINRNGLKRFDNELQRLTVDPMSLGDVEKFCRALRESELNCMATLQLPLMSKGDLEKFKVLARESGLKYTIS